MRQIQGKTVGVVELERHGTAEEVFGVFKLLFKQLDPRRDRGEEALLFDAHRLFDRLLTLFEVGVVIPHDLHQHIHQSVHERLPQTQHITVAHRPAQNAAQHVAPPFVAEVDPLGQQEGGGAQMVGDDPVTGPAFVLVGFAHHLLHGTDDRHKKLSVVVTEFAFFDRHHPFQPHAGVDGGFGQRVQIALAISFVLHENEVPNLQKAIPVAPHVIFGAVKVLLALIVKDFAAGPARTRVAHLPKVVFITHAVDAALVNMLGPNLSRFVVAFMHRDVELLLGQRQHFGDELPGVGDGILFEVVAEAEIAQHLEKGVVARGMADVF